MNTGIQGLKTYSIVLQGQKKEARLEIEQTGQMLVPIWDAGTIDGVLTLLHHGARPGLSLL